MLKTMLTSLKLLWVWNSGRTWLVSPSLIHVASVRAAGLEDPFPTQLRYYTLASDAPWSLSLSPHHGAPSSRPLHVVWAPQQQGGLGVATPLTWRKEVETSRPVKGCYWNQQGIISSRCYWSKGSQHLARLSGAGGQNKPHLLME